MKEKPRAAKRHVPKRPRAWNREVAGIERFLARTYRLSLDEGNEWVCKMRAYYKERLNYLKRHKPQR